jgi:prepilin-type N-terminal cleavage/methylation domain-containing protein
MKPRKGFTLIELLVVIAVIALLLAVIVPALKKAKSMALRLTCTSNLHQVGLAMHCYATMYDNFLPAPEVPSVGDWLIDIPEVAADFIYDQYDTIEFMYCPANSLKEYNSDELRDYYESHKVFGWVITDYFWLMTFGVDWRLDLEYEDRSRLYGRKIFTEKLGVGATSAHPLVTDVSFTEDSEDMLEQDFTEVSGWDPFVFRTNHVKGIIPEGTNIVYCDGSTEWLDFSKMTFNYKGFDAYHYW